MNVLLAGVTAFVLAWSWDRLLQRLGWPELLRVGWLVPCGEELIKLGTAAFFGMPYWWIHPVFGTGEGLYETYRLFHAFRISVVALGALTHLVFGIGYGTPLHPGLSLLMAIAIHAAWNSWIVINHYKQGSD
ncbi:hypothetical protein EDC14_1002105 [Hydrogenispora ethanolica]|jgi:hypothetical protein|uniref:CAAX prenyl protease-like protein n=1 Tax=Hydrogenispora ethanolica TaxID=1082276 RepID=A0A4R1SA82_HYDET|nr:hypothetical protein [Hydrogenispora ethanolica]TCL76348.1 hypothetical protein EDC14_1002105 [Hydrogenispora ethanolica]